MNLKSQVLGIPKKDKKPYPIIEILGPIDIGKQPIAQLVARRLKGNHISFPSLDPTTYTGRALLEALTQFPRKLELAPEWWAHIYAANMYEQKWKLEEVIKRPLVVTNYTFAFRLWMKVVGIDMTRFLINLPQPNKGYVLVGNPLVPIDKPLFDFSPEFRHKIKRSMASLGDKRIERINMSLLENRFHHISVNQTAIAISQSAAATFNLKVDESALYTIQSFPTKKDLK